MPESFEVESEHFPKSLLRRPAVEGHAIGSQKYSGAIATEPAVHKDLLLRIVANKRKELSNLFVSWRLPSIARNIHKVNAHRFRKPALLLHDAVSLAPQVNDRMNSEFLKLLETLLTRLGAPIKKSIDFARVGDARDVNVFGRNTLKS